MDGVLKWATAFFAGVGVGAMLPVALLSFEPRPCDSPTGFCKPEVKVKPIKQEK